MFPPGVDFHSGLVHRSEPGPIQTFIPEFTIQALHERVLGRFAGLNEAQTYTRFLAPEKHRLAGEFSAVITDDFPRLASVFAKLRQETRHLAPTD
tara:strand:+ start:166 stop:450 length:285 start_codon:yes stop_codon:yes gene_type:complete